MLESTLDTPAESTSTSLTSRGGNSLRPSGRDVVPAYSTLIDMPFCENELVLSLMAMLVGVTTFTTSGDVMAIGMSTAEDICAKHGLSPDKFRPIAKQFLRESWKLRKWNKLAYQEDM